MQIFITCALKIVLYDVFPVHGLQLITSIEGINIKVNPVQVIEVLHAKQMLHVN